MSDSKTVFSTPWFSLVARYTGAAGGEPHYSIRANDYVSVLAWTEAGRFILVRQFRPAVQATTLELPAGHVDPGETPESAALRELEEETGYRAASAEVIARLKPDTGRLGNHMWCVLASGLERVHPTGEPGIEVVECDHGELVGHILAGRLDHAMQLGLLLVAHLSGRVQLGAMP